SDPAESDKASEAAPQAVEPRPADQEDVPELASESEDSAGSASDDTLPEEEFFTDDAEDFGSVRRGLYTTPDEVPDSGAGETQTAEPGSARRDGIAPERSRTARSVAVTPAIPAAAPES